MISYYTEALEASPLDAPSPDDSLTEKFDRHHPLLSLRTRQTATDWTERCVSHSPQ